jgi:hypothetical protein
MRNSRHALSLSHRILKRNLKFIITISATLVAILYTIVKLLDPQHWFSTHGWALPVFTIVICLSYLLLLSIEEGMVIEWIFKLASRLKPHEYKGQWNIQITYQHPQHGQVVRQGSCFFSDNITGLQINGGTILSTRNQQVQADNWESSSVQLLEFNNETRLVYTYYVFDNRGDIEPSKIGIGVLTRKNDNDPFIGNFRDIYAKTGSTLLEGEIQFFK